MQFELKHGLAFGEENQKEVEVRELTTADLIDAQTAAEKLAFDKNANPIFVTSPTLFSYELLRRQIKRVGKIQGPLSMQQLRQLHPEDVEIINAYLDAVETAKTQQVIERGRMAAADNGI